MTPLVRHVVTLVALVAFLVGAARVQPCLEDDECAMSCTSAAALSCPASDEHHDPVAPIHSCDCMCHVPGVAAGIAVAVRPSPLVDAEPVALSDRVSLGFLESPFRPPRT